MVPPTVTKMLPGRNCLLGTLVDSIFTSVAALTEKKAVICTDKGDICTIDDNDGQNHLLKVANAGFAVSAISVDDAKKLIRFGGRCGANKVMALDELLKPSTPPASPCQDEFEGDDLSPNGSICAMAVVNDYVVTADTRHAIKITKKDQPITAAATVPYTAHCDPVMGVRLFSQPNAFSSDFYTYDSSGKVLFWDLEAKCKGSFHVEIEQADLSPDDVLNQCLVVRAATSNSFFATGDKYGILRIIDAKDYTCTFMAKAHLSDIEDIAIFEDSKTTLIATCGRDRTVQLFKKDSDSWTHLQTMDEHTGSVVSVRFCDNGERLLTASSDRTVVIRQVVTREVEGDQVTAAIPIRVLTVKGTPVSLALATNDLTGAFSVVVSMMDRNIATFDVETGKLQRVFKAADGEGNDSVVMSSIVMGKSVGGRPTVLAGVSGTDKSVRIYDGRSGIFLDRGFGHTASVTDIALLESPEQTVLISTGSDSTIMIWDLTAKTPEVVIQPDMPLTNDESTPSKEATTATMPPLRRILSKAELAEFQRSSPAATPSGRNSPPRLRKKISKHSLNKTESPKLNPAPPMPGHHGSYSDEISSSTLHNRERSERSERETRELRNSPRDRNRSRSPPSSPKSRRNDNRSSVNSNSENRGLGLGSRKSSMIDLRSSRGKPPLPSPGEFSSLNMSTDQMCRSLRSYRKKLDSTDSVRDELTSDLVRELQLTAQAVERRRERDCVVYREREREREQSRQSGSRKISDTLLVGLLDQYSDRLIRVFDEKLRLSMLGGTPEVEEKPKAIDSIIESIEVEMPETKKLPLPRSAPASTPVSRKPSTSGSVIITTTAAPEKEATISPQVLIEPCTPEPRVLVEFPEPEDPTADDKDETFLSAKGPGSRVSSTATTASASTSASTPAVAVPERKSSSNRESIIVPKNEHRNSVRAAAASWGRKSVVLTGKGEGGGLEPQSRPGLRRKSRSTTALP